MILNNDTVLKRVYLILIKCSYFIFIQYSIDNIWYSFSVHRMISKDDIWYWCSVHKMIFHIDKAFIRFDHLYGVQKMIFDIHIVFKRWYFIFIQRSNDDIWNRYSAYSKYAVQSFCLTLSAPLFQSSGSGWIQSLKTENWLWNVDMDLKETKMQMDKSLASKLWKAGKFWNKKCIKGNWLDLD